MFTRPEIASALGKFVLVDLYGDGTDAASEENQKLELSKFNTVAEPYYAILDPDEKVIATFPGLTKDPAEFQAFLAKADVPVSAAAAPAAPALAASALPAATVLNGKPLALEGKVAVVNFWATWCVPCIQEIPSFNKLHREFADKGVQVVGISMDEEGKERVEPFLKKHPMEYTVALGSEALNKQYQLDQLPVTLVYDKSGKQIKRFEGFLKEEELLAAVKEAL
jgi:thiol-disulfide isomerase/thioredoxin